MKNLKTAKLKIRVTPEQSEHVQKICFENGVEWGLNGEEVIRTEKPYLFINAVYVDEHLGYSDDKEYFKDCDNTEITYKDFVEKYEKRKEIPYGFKRVNVRFSNLDEWEERILFQRCNNNKCFCVHQNDEENFIKEDEFRVVKWTYTKEIEEPKKIPYTAESILKGGFIWIKRIGYYPIFRINEIHKEHIYYCGVQKAKYADIDDWEISGIDGNFKPFYKLEK